LSYTKDTSRYLSGGCYWKTDGLPYVHLQTRKLLRTRTGDSNPQWRQQIKVGANATTQMSAVFTNAKKRRCTASMTYREPLLSQTKRYQEFTGDFAWNFYPPDGYIGGWTSNADSRAATQYLKQVRATVQSMSGPTFLGELRETLKMLRNPAAGLFDGIKRYLDHVKELNRENRRRYFHKKPKKYARNLSAIASQSWLEYAFGWVPFLNDIENIRDTFNEGIEVDRVVKVSGGGKDFYQRLLTTYPGSLNPYSSIKTLVSVNRHETHIVRYRGAVWARAETTASDRLARWGFHPSEFLPTAWELLPWSFLADYVANLGDLIEAQMTDTSSVMWTNYTTIKRAHYAVNVDPNKSYNYSLQGSNFVIDAFDSVPGSYVWTQDTVSRNKATVPVPSLIFRLPRSPGKLLNVAALLAQVGISIHPQAPSNRTWRR